MLTEDDLRTRLREGALQQSDGVPDLLPALRKRSRQRFRMQAAASVASVAVTLGAAAATAQVVTVTGGPERLAGVPTANPDVSRQDAPFIVDESVAPVSSPAASLGRLQGQGDVVAFLKGQAESSESMLCTALAGEDRRITTTDPISCAGPAKVQNGDDLVFPPLAPLVGNYTIPIADDAMPTAPPCSYGPLGNRLILLASTRTETASILATGGYTVAMTPVAGTETWPLRLFVGDLPPETFVVGQELRDAAGSLLSPRDPMQAATCADLGRG